MQQVEDPGAWYRWLLSFLREASRGCGWILPTNLTEALQRPYLAGPGPAKKGIAQPCRIGGRRMQQPRVSTNANVSLLVLVSWDSRSPFKDFSPSKNISHGFRWHSFQLQKCSIGAGESAEATATRARSGIAAAGSGIETQLVKGPRISMGTQTKKQADFLYVECPVAGSFPQLPSGVHKCVFPMLLG